MRTKVVAGNWKMNTTLEAASALVKDIAERYTQHKDPLQTKIILCPPFLYIPGCKEILRDLPALHIGAQNCHNETKGAYTGEISAEMLASAGAEYIIIGHSERRMYFGETSALLKKKVQACLAAGLTPIFCCGEQLQERESGNHFAVVGAQITEALLDLEQQDFKKIILAYEPVWAIGTGLTASPAQAQEMHQFIRNLTGKTFGAAVAEETIILYGGSCNAANAEELFSQKDVDGGLIGGASLKGGDFFTIIKAAHQTMQ